MKIFYLGRRINGRFDSFKAWIKRLVRATVRLAMIGGIGWAIFVAGGLLYSTTTVTAQVVQAPLAAPVLERIADCESGSGKAGTGTQFAKNGQVLLHANTNGTVDVGKYAVNATYWGAKATELGLDLTKEADNYQMAQWIYLNKGTGDWSASAHCWQH